MYIHEHDKSKAKESYLITDIDGIIREADFLFSPGFYIT